MKTLNLIVSNKLFEYLKKLEMQPSDEEMAQVVFSQCIMDHIRQSDDNQIFADARLEVETEYCVPTSGPDTVRHQINYEIDYEEI